MNSRKKGVKVEEPHDSDQGSIFLLQKELSEIKVSLSSLLSSLLSSIRALASFFKGINYKTGTKF